MITTETTKVNFSSTISLRDYILLFTLVISIIIALWRYIIWGWKTKNQRGQEMTNLSKTPEEQYRKEARRFENKTKTRKIKRVLADEQTLLKGHRK